MVSRLLTIITGRLSPRIFECTHGLKQTNIQSRWSEFYKYIDRLLSPANCCTQYNLQCPSIPAISMMPWVVSLLVVLVWQSNAFMVSVAYTRFHCSVRTWHPVRSTTVAPLDTVTKCTTVTSNCAHWCALSCYGLAHLAQEDFLWFLAILKVYFSLWNCLNAKWFCVQVNRF